MRGFLKKIFPESVLPYAIVGIAFTAFLFIFFGVRKIESDSMTPTLRDGDRVVYFRFSSPKKFGIFFIDDPKNTDLKLVKRIVGLPGEKIKDHNTFFIIPAKHYYVLGDNRGAYWGDEVWGPVVSLDSR